MAIIKVLSIIRMIVSLALLLMPSAISFAAEYYVDGITGSDANDGSAALPWKTIGHALTPAGRWPGAEANTLYIQHATYNEALDLKPIPLRSLNIKGLAQDGNMPKIDANGADQAIDIWDFNGIIEGLEITGATENGVNIAGESLTMQLVGCKVHGNKKGIHATDTSTPLISGNFIVPCR